ncbi:hypothetical protein PFISCL1PPCAC_16160 [Pristionchus fissidentatus]|uniref:Uncharacterized protein n=1 Tax=Pristionchus fissidentatus TaxID=1538716 RepID=A0AAV5W2D5_9BILA|nr:hypothetical protein PFISCL1PPCAC_16160 [Pristionchus fissidentatus]
MNSSISVNSSLFEIYPPVWRDSHCLNSVIKARLIFTLSRNEEEIESARIDRLIYASLSVSNYSTITPSIEIRYETSTRRKGETVEEFGGE